MQGKEARSIAARTHSPSKSEIETNNATRSQIRLKVHGKIHEDPASDLRTVQLERFGLRAFMVASRVLLAAFVDDEKDGLVPFDCQEEEPPVLPAEWTRLRGIINEGDIGCAVPVVP